MEKDFVVILTTSEMKHVLKILENDEVKSMTHYTRGDFDRWLKRHERVKEKLKAVLATSALILLLGLLPALSWAGSSPVVKGYGKVNNLEFLYRDGKVYDANWKLQYHIRDNKVYDQKWELKYQLKQDGIVDPGTEMNHKGR